MPRRAVDPANLEGEALNRWYLRTPTDVEVERRVAADQRHQEFFGQPQLGPELALPEMQPQHTLAGDDDVLWMPTGRGGYRAVRGGSSGSWSSIDEGPVWPGALPAEPAAPEFAAFLNVGNPENKRLKQEYIQKHGYWPKAADGRDYDVSHIRAIADGGTNTLDNIEPMDPDEHRAKHQRDGDPQRYGKRPGIARAFGGKVEPPAHAPKPARSPRVNGLGLLGLIPNITGILSGRIRTDSFDNFTSDMLGYPSQEDIRRRNEELRRRYFPNSKPGDLVA
ncbi:HNH endonuclease signature motif containing protein [Phenylobacterium sp.]|uniref:HNH endonuclease signature motif containing protein n=1 Tax=Phenylobacterium sp. TaxID=1871053 RepID=UPI00289C961E|nr:HNH endonuclease signature motif containing protein [Phenylobacterium sp.]